MTMIEDALRKSLAAQVEVVPVLDDPAALAIRRARAAHRRRTLSSSLAAALVLSLTLGSLVALRGWWQSSGAEETAGPAIALTDEEPASSSSGSALTQRSVIAGPDATLRLLGVDVRVHHELWTVEGRRFSLSGVGLVTRVYRVPEGWVYGGAEHVRLLRPDGTSVELDSGRGWLLSPDGMRLAYVKERLLQVSPIGKAGLDKGRTVEVPDGATPVALVGDRVVIADGADVRFDALDPAGRYSPTWNSDIMAVYGTAGDTVTGLVRDRKAQTVCLAALEPGSTGLAVRRRGGCVAARGATMDTRWLSPDGVHLAKPERGRLVLINLDRTFAGAGKASTACSVNTVVPPAWVDSTTLVAADQRGAVLCRTDGTVQRMPLPDGLDTDWEFVPNMSS